MILSKKTGKYSLATVLILGLSGCEWTILEGTGPEWDVVFGVSSDIRGNVITAGYTRYFPDEPSASRRSAKSFSQLDRLGHQDLLGHRDILNVENTELSVSSEHTKLTASTEKLRASASEFNNFDANVMKIDALKGEVIWSKNYNYSPTDIAYASATDLQGNIYIAGMSAGDFGNTGASCGTDDERDSFVAKMDKDGEMIWSKMICLEKTSRAQDVKVDTRGNVYVTGIVGNARAVDSISGYVTKYDRNGNSQYNTSIEISDKNVYLSSLVIDRRGRVYVAGDTNGSLEGENAGGYDIFVSKLNRRGEVAWTTQYGSDENDFGGGMTLNARNSKLHIAGVTRGDLGGQNAGGADTVLTTMNLKGSIAWTKQFGTELMEVHQDVTATRNGKIVISGMTVDPKNRNHDMNIMQVSKDGTLLANDSYGAPEDFDFCVSIANSGYNTVYAAGASFGNFEGLENAGGHDKVVKHIDVNNKRK